MRRLPARLTLPFLAALGLTSALSVHAQDAVRVGSKIDTEGKAGAAAPAAAAVDAAKDAAAGAVDDVRRRRGVGVAVRDLRGG